MIGSWQEASKKLTGRLASCISAVLQWYKKMFAAYRRTRFVVQRSSTWKVGVRACVEENMQLSMQRAVQGHRGRECVPANYPPKLAN